MIRIILVRELDFGADLYRQQRRDEREIFLGDFAQLGFGSLDRNRTTWHKIKAFPNNLELEVEATFQLAELLRQTARGREAEPLDRQALAICTRLAEHFPSKWNYRLAEAELHYHLGHLLWSMGRAEEAEAAFGRAWEFLEHGTGDLLLEARVLELEASLRSDRRCLEDAITLLGRAHDLYCEAGDNHLAGRALISKGINIHYQGHPETAVIILEAGLSLVDPSRDYQICAIGKQDLLHALVDAGEYGRASRLILAGGLREAFSSEPLNLLKLRWMEGKIHVGLGRLNRAERILYSVREELLHLGRHYDAAVLGLELAAVWLRQSRASEVRVLAEEMYETFELVDFHQEAQHALYFVREACRWQRVTVPMIQGVRSFMERLTRNPELRFEPAEYVG